MGRWAQRRRAGSDTTGALAARVTAVQKTGANQLTWTFNVIVISNGSAVPQLNDDALSSQGAPTATVQGGTKSVVCTYSQLVNVGNGWSVGSTPTNLTNPNGSGFTIPLSGTVT
jgi:hypothetical protein